MRTRTESFALIAGTEHNRYKKLDKTSKTTVDPALHVKEKTGDAEPAVTDVICVETDPPKEVTKIVCDVGVDMAIARDIVVETTFDEPGVPTKETGVDGATRENKNGSVAVNVATVTKNGTKIAKIVALSETLSEAPVGATKNRGNNPGAERDTKHI